MQPMQPQQAAAAAAHAASGSVVPKPPANLSMANVETDKIAGSPGPARSLKALFQQCEAAAGANPARKKEVEDSSKRIAGLLWKLNRADVSASVCGKLLQLCASLDAGDVAARRRRRRRSPPATGTRGARGSPRSSGCSSSDRRSDESGEGE